MLHLLWVNLHRGNNAKQCRKYWINSQSCSCRVLPTWSLMSTSPRMLSPSFTMTWHAAFQPRWYGCVFSFRDLVNDVWNENDWSYLCSLCQKNDKTQELIEVPVKDLTFDQLQLLKVKIQIKCQTFAIGWWACWFFYQSVIGSCLMHKKERLLSRKIGLLGSFQLPKSSAVATTTAVST